MDRFLVFLADGFEEIEALTLVDYFRRADIFVDTVSVGDDLFVCGSHDIIVKTDRLIDDIDLDFYDGIYIPGGSLGAKNLRDDKRVIDIVKKFDEEKKIICAICAGPSVLDRAGIVSDRALVCHPSVEKSLLNVGKIKSDELIVVDGNIFTSRGAGASVFLALKLIEKIKGIDVKERIKSGIQEDFVEKYFGFNFWYKFWINRYFLLIYSFFVFLFYLKKGLYMLKYKNTDRYLISIKIIFLVFKF